jgi:polygalacturonase
MEINIYPCENVTGKIQNAIDEVSANGGGKVILNDGEYLLKSILLKSDVCLYLKAGVFIKGSRNVDDYDLSAIFSCPDGEDYLSIENCPLAKSGRGYKKTGGSNNPFSRWSRALIKAYR